MLAYDLFNPELLSSRYDFRHQIVDDFHIDSPVDWRFFFGNRITGSHNFCRTWRDVININFGWPNALSFFSIFSGKEPQCREALSIE